uniref:Uncharacterized protein n=1 Tax=Zea mays TaxID=4577 RepID=B4F8S2_MAIZE|nr:unknown [Zea mays]|eukprot:NP_001130330.1 uncharacterized protein LOC100191425 [Zea mays]
MPTEATELRRRCRLAGTARSGQPGTAWIGPRRVPPTTTTTTPRNARVKVGELQLRQRCPRGRRSGRRASRASSTQRGTRAGGRSTSTSTTTAAAAATFPYGRSRSRG